MEFFTGSLVWYTLLVLPLTLLLVYFFRHQKKAWLINQIPGPEPLPIFGNALEVNVNPRELFILFREKYCKYDSSISRFWLGFTPYCLLYKANSVEAVLGNQKHIDKSRDYRFLFPWLGTGLLTSAGSKWHSRRKMLTPAFHFKILEDFLEIFNQQSFRMVEKLEPKADGTPFDIFPFITLCALDIILESAMGTSIRAQDNSESEYVKSIYSISALIQHRQARPWLHPNLLFKLSGHERVQNRYLKVLHSFCMDTIRERMKEFQNISQRKEMMGERNEPEKGKKRLAFLDLLLEYSKDNALSVEDIREEVDTFMFEGHDTTAAGINWTLYLLGCHPEIQEEVHAELDSIFGLSDREVTSEDLREMKLLECCIKESLRLFPSVPMIARELKEDTVIDGYKIPSGTTFLILTYTLHRDPVYFPDPEVFKPERFFPEQAVNRHPYAYIPFSAGPRNCIGQRFAMMEEKIVLANVLRRYRVESTVRREDLKLLAELILRPEDGNILKLFPR